MKSSLAYYVLYHNALEGAPGLYVTLEQTAAGLLEHVASLGLKATAVSEALPILDLSRGREYLEDMVAKVGSMAETAAPRGEALLAVLKAKIFELRMRRNFRLLAIDSWDALELVLEFDDRRAETFGFFEWLRDLGVTSLLISEEPALEAPAATGRHRPAEAGPPRTTSAGSCRAAERSSAFAPEPLANRADRSAAAADRSCHAAI